LTELQNEENGEFELSVLSEQQSSGSFSADVHFYASNARGVARVILFLPVCAFVCVCVRSFSVSMNFHLWESGGFDALMTNFHQTYSNNTLWDGDEY